jgi:hypothetical protein
MVLLYCTDVSNVQTDTPFTPCHSAKQAAHVQHLSSLKWLNDVARFREWNRDPRLGPQDIAHAYGPRGRGLGTRFNPSVEQPGCLDYGL